MLNGAHLQLNHPCPPTTWRKLGKKRHSSGTSPASCAAPSGGSERLQILPRPSAGHLTAELGDRSHCVASYPASESRLCDSRRLPHSRASWPKSHAPKVCCVLQDVPRAASPSKKTPATEFADRRRCVSSEIVVAGAASLVHLRAIICKDNRCEGTRGPFANAPSGSRSRTLRDHAIIG